MSGGHDAPQDRLAPVLLGQAPSHAERVRTLVESTDQATLCTLVALPPDSTLGVEGFPYGSVVRYALDAQGCPLLLTSRMAEHTRNFLADPRASLLVCEDHASSSAGQHNPLALGRVTLVGRIEAVPENEVEAARASYLACHPDARQYVDYRDFDFYRLRVEALRYIGGFGRMSWVDTQAYCAAAADPIAVCAAALLDELKEAYLDDLVALCVHLAGVPGVGTARAVGLDRYGLELDAHTAAGVRRVRLGFDAPVSREEQARAALLGLIKQAKANADRGNSTNDS